MTFNEFVKNFNGKATDFDKRQWCAVRGSSKNVYLLCTRNRATSYWKCRGILAKIQRTIILIH